MIYILDFCDEFNTADGSRCITCDTECQSTEDLAQHYIEHHTYEILPGFNVEMSSELNSVMSESVENSDPVDTVVCKKCEMVFTSRSGMMRHYADQHLDLGDYECLKCGVTFKHNGHFKGHVRLSHQGGRHVAWKGDKYSCPICNLVSFNLEKIGRHVREHFKQHLPGVQCSSFPYPLCKFGSDNKADLYIHMGEHFTDEVDVKGCQICGADTLTHEEMLDHAVQKHEIAYDAQLALPTHTIAFQCLKCGIELRDVNDCISHIKMHKVSPPPTPSNIKPTKMSALLSPAKQTRTERGEAFPCPLCEFSGRDINAARRHMRSHFKDLVSDGDYNSSICWSCESAHPSLKTLREHYKSKHDVQITVAEKCRLCDVYIQNSVQGLKHLEAHSKADVSLPPDFQPLKCVFCNEDVVSFSELEKHSRRHRGLQFPKHLRGDFPCPLCEHNAHDVDAARMHLRFHWSVEVAETDSFNLACYICESIFASKGDVQQHIKTKHFVEETSSEKCRLCEKSIRTPEEGLMHLAHQCDPASELPMGVQPFQCVFCSEEVTSLRDLMEHSKNHRGSKHPKHLGERQRAKVAEAKRTKSSGDFPCPLCQYSSKRCTYTFVQHLRSHFRGEDTETDFKYLTCFFCPSNFSSTDGLGIHLKAKHFSDATKTEPCKVCGLLINSFEAASRHMNCHSEPDIALSAGEKPFKCGFCCVELTCLRELLEHSRKHRGAKHPSSSVDNQRTEGIDVGPKGSGDFPCPLCDQSFSISKSCTFHIRSHFRNHVAENDFRYISCSLCESIFSSSNGLKKHLAAKHFSDEATAEKCRLCGKCLDNQASGLVHMIRHSGNPDIALPANASPFKCLFCGENTTNLRQLVEHSKNHRGLKFSDRLLGDGHPLAGDGCETVKACGKYPCPLCPYSYPSIPTIRIHMRSHFRDLVSETDYRNLACFICGTAFCSIPALRGHFRTKHFQEETAIEKCMLCSLSFNTYYAGSKHVVAHINFEVALPPSVPRFKCVFCNEEVASLTELVDHSKKHKGMDYNKTTQSVEPNSTLSDSEK